MMQDVEVEFIGDVKVSTGGSGEGPTSERAPESNSPPKKTEPAGSPVQKDLIPLDADGLFKPTSENQLKRFVSYVMGSGMVPKSLDTPQKVMIAMQYGASFGIPPMKALRRVYIVNGTPSFWGEMPLSLVMKGGKLARIVEFIVDREYKPLTSANKNLDAEPFAAICQTWRKDAIDQAIQFRKIFNGDKLPPDMLKEVMDETMKETSFSVIDAEKAGLLHATGKLYGKYLKDMLKYRARSRNLLDNFADDVQGMNMLEHHFPEEFTKANETRDVTNQPAQLANASTINDDFLNEPTVEAQ